MNKVRKLTSTMMSFLVFALFPVIAQGLGIGSVRLHSNLNEPLNAEIGLDALNENQASDIKVSIANKEIYEKSGFTPVNWLQTIHFTVKKNPTTNEFVIELSTKDPIKDPYVDLLIEVIWPGGKMVKEYTLLFDPPKVSIPPSQQLPRKSKASPMLETQLAANVGAPGKVAQLVKERAQVRRLARAHSRIVRPGTQYGPVYDETLWSIAKKLVENTPYSIYQGIAAIASKNPQAFRLENINALAEGATLDLPSVSELAQLNKTQAQQFVELQNNGWQHKNVQLSQAVATPSQPPVVAKQQKPLKLVAPALQPPNENITPESHQQNQAQQTTQPAPTSKSAPMSSRLSLIEEAIDTMKRSNEDITQKNQSLQTQNQTLMDLLSSKEAEIAKLKEAAHKNGEFAPSVTHENYAVAKPDKAAHTQGPHLLPQSLPPHPEPTKKSLPPVEKSKPQQSPISHHEEHPIPPKSKGSVTAWLMVMIGLIGLLALWFGRKTWVAWLSRWPVKSSERDLAAENTPTTDNVVENQHQNVAGTFDPVSMGYGMPFDLTKSLAALSKQEKKYTRQEKIMLSASELNEQENDHSHARELEEAEVYIAYERYAQAENILQGILAKHPHQWDVILKLLEIYVLTEKYDEFEKWYSTLPTELREVSPAIWSKIELLQEKVLSEKGIALPQGNKPKAEKPYFDLPTQSPNDENDVEPALDLPLEKLTYPNIKAKENPKESENTGHKKPFIDLEKKYALTLDEDIDLDADNTQLTSKPSNTENNFHGLNELLPEVTDNISQEEAKILKTGDLLPKPSYSPDNEILSQLSLAQAYVEIGDIDAARELLTEALAQGSVEEKLQIQALLDKINQSTAK